jgi:hypothetical protein
MNAQERLARRQRRACPRNIPKQLGIERLLYRYDSFRALGMTMTRIVVEAGWVREKKRRHQAFPLSGGRNPSGPSRQRRRLSIAEQLIFARIEGDASHYFGSGSG